MEGGQDKYNIVCGQAEAKVDTRFASISDRDKLHGKIDKILKRIYTQGAKTEYELADDCPPTFQSSESRPFIAQYIRSIDQAEGRQVLAGKSGGAADSNYFSRSGIIIIDGLGPIGGKMHSESEFVTLASLETRAEAFKRFLTGLE